MPHASTIRLPASPHVVPVVGGLALALVGLDVGLHLGGGVASYDLARLFDSTSETGLGSYIAVTQTGLVALTLWALAGLARARGDGRAHVAAWVVLAAALSYVALDDGTRLHERVGSAFAESDARDSLLGRFPSYYWQVLFGPVFVAFGVFLLAFLWRTLRDAEARWRVAGAGALLGLAVLLDFTDGLGSGHAFNINARWGGIPAVEAIAFSRFALTGPELVEHLSRSVEESLEIVAMAMLWSALLGHAAHVAPRVRVEWGPPAPEAAFSGDGAAASVEGPAEPPVVRTAETERA